jgi:hypothetical protein
MMLLPQASDALKVSEYLHDTYGELGLNTEFIPRVHECRNKGFRVLSMLHVLTGRVSRAISALLFTPSLDKGTQSLECKNEVSPRLTEPLHSTSHRTSHSRRAAALPLRVQPCHG